MCLPNGPDSVSSSHSDRTTDFHLQYVVETSTSPEPPPSKRRAPSSPFIEAPSPTEKGTPPPSPPAYAPAYNKATEDVVATILPVLQSILPELIRPLLAVAPLFSAPSSTNIDAKKPSYLSALLDARVAACIDAQQSKIYDGMHDHAEQINNAAGIELEEAFRDHKENIDLAKEDGIMELNDALNNAIDDKLQELQMD
jgi:hypothetical protein